VSRPSRAELFAAACSNKPWVKSTGVVYEVVVRFFDFVVQAVSAAGVASCSVAGS
jgi:hypothetical protein